jgi:hypothetical protein
VKIIAILILTLEKASFSLLKVYSFPNKLYYIFTTFPDLA